MGGLLGIPHYSKLEFILLAFTSTGLFLAWATDPALGLVTVLGLLTGTLYMLVCSVLYCTVLYCTALHCTDLHLQVCLLYGLLARQNWVAFAVPGLATLAMLLWRATRWATRLELQISSENQ